MPQPNLQGVQLRRSYQVCLVQDKNVCKGNLLLAFHRRRQVLLDVATVDDGDHSVQDVRSGDLSIDKEGLGHGRWISQSCGLNQDTVKAVPPLEQRSQDADEVAAHCATNAAVVHLKDFFVGPNDQGIIDANLAKLVLDNSNSLAVMLGQDAIEQGSLASAQEASQQGNGDALYGHGALAAAVISPTRTHWHKPQSNATKVHMQLTDDLG
jgi:hypothetical protein